VDLTLNVFEDLNTNSYVKYWGGVITSENQHLEVTNSLFRNNQFGADIGAVRLSQKPKMHTSFFDLCPNMLYLCSLPTN
jgi:hypothetical protein